MIFPRNGLTMHNYIYCMFWISVFGNIPYNDDYRDSLLGSSIIVTEKRMETCREKDNQFISFGKTLC